MPTDPFDGAGSLRCHYEDVDWAATPLGPASSWSPALRGALDIVLHTRFPGTLMWGSDLVLLYNEAYVPLIADKHPAALGSRAQDVFPEAWDTIGPLLRGVLDGAGATWVEDAHLPLQRRGRLEECWFTFSYSPVSGPDGVVEGVLDIAAETTPQVLDRRRLQLLGRLGEVLADARGRQDVRERALPVLRGAPADLPAVDVRVSGPPLAVACGADTDTGTEPQLPAAPSSPLTGRDVLVEQTATGAVAWLPLGEAAPAAQRAVLVVRLSDHLAPDETYLGLLRLVAASLSQALGRVDARQAEQRAAASEREGELRTGALLESMATAFFSLDASWRFTYVNTEAERVLGRRRQELLGGVLWDLFPAAVGSDFEEHYRRAVATGCPVTFDAHYPAPLDAWFEVRAVPERGGLSVYFLDITARRAAQEATERAAARAQLLARVAAELAEGRSAESTLARLGALLVPALADWCILTTVDDGPEDWRTRLRDVSSWHADPAARELTERYRRARAVAVAGPSSASGASEPRVVQHGGTAAASAGLSGAARELCVELAPEAFVVLPLRGRGHTLGLLSVFNGAERGPFSATDLATLRELSAQVGLALDNAHLHAAQRDLAEELQHSLLTGLPEPDHLEVAARYAPAARGAQVGGDWYDAFLTGDGATLLVIGDVTGHDRGAAVAMAQVRNVLRGVAQALVEPPAAILAALDRAMDHLALGALTTAVVVRVEQNAQDAARSLRTLRWANAGHPPPLLLHPDGRAELLERDSDLLLGLLPGTSRHDHTCRLEPGATVLLYTDGLVERRGESLAVGLERLRLAVEQLAQLSLDELCDALLAELAGDAEDDVALLAVRAHPQDAPRPAEAGPPVMPDDLRDLTAGATPLTR